LTFDGDKMVQCGKRSKDNQFNAGAQVKDLAVSAASGYVWNARLKAAVTAKLTILRQRDKVALALN
jgi:hypothetical protein